MDEREHKELDRRATALRASCQNPGAVLAWIILLTQAGIVAALWLPAAMLRLLQVRE